MPPVSVVLPVTNSEEPKGIRRRSPCVGAAESTSKEHPTDRSSIGIYKTP